MIWWNLITNTKQEQECCYFSLHLSFLSLTKYTMASTPNNHYWSVCSSLGRTSLSSFLSKQGINEFYLGTSKLTKGEDTDSSKIIDTVQVSKG